MRTFSYDPPARRFDSTQLGMAAKPDYPPNSYLRQMIYPFTGRGGCASEATTTPNGATQTSTPRPGLEESLLTGSSRAATRRRLPRWQRPPGDVRWHCRFSDSAPRVDQDCASPSTDISTYFSMWI